MGTVLGAFKNKTKIIQTPGLDLLYVRHFYTGEKVIIDSLPQYLKFVMNLQD